jgi:carbonic anhydrase
MQGLFENIGVESMVMYEGSLTVPPCTENIMRFLYDDPQTISFRQLLLLKTKFDMNNRMLQDTGSSLLYGSIMTTDQTCPCC